MQTRRIRINHGVRPSEVDVAYAKGVEEGRKSVVNETTRELAKVKSAYETLMHDYAQAADAVETMDKDKTDLMNRNISLLEILTDVKVTVHNLSIRTKRVSRAPGRLEVLRGIEDVADHIKQLDDILTTQGARYKF